MLSRRRRRTLLAGFALASSIASTAAANTAPRPGFVPCRYPTLAIADRWTRLAHPAGATEPVSVQQLDQSACTLLAADADGRRWRSGDAGEHWTALAGGPLLTRLLTERLQPRAGGTTVGAVLGVGPADDPSGLPQVWVSDDSGNSFTAAQLDVSLDLPLGPLGHAGTTLPLRMAVAGATTRRRPGDAVRLPGRARDDDGGSWRGRRGCRDAAQEHRRRAHVPGRRGGAAAHADDGRGQPDEPGGDLGQRRAAGHPRRRRVGVVRRRRDVRGGLLRGRDRPRRRDR